MWNPPSAVGLPWDRDAKDHRPITPQGQEKLSLCAIEVKTTLNLFYRHLKLDR